MMNELLCKRIYNPAEISDGYRILVDRLWPRGVKKEVAAIDLWRKDIGDQGKVAGNSILDMIYTFSRKKKAENAS